jgi:hypothetical protein
LSPEIFLKAPAEPIPSLFNVKASAPIAILLYNSKAAPDATVTPPAVVPSAVALPALNAPAVIVVRPV